MDTTKLSININKYALLRNSRGHNAPNLLEIIDIVLEAGAHGITIHPRRDQRHIRFDDVPVISDYLTLHHPGVELNIECELHPELIDMVVKLRPAQCTLVPVTPGEITSDHGWDLNESGNSLRTTLSELRDVGIRSSIFMDCVPDSMQHAAEVGTDRIELYTGPYAWAWGGPEQVTQTQLLLDTAKAAAKAGLGVNAGHDLDRHNLAGIAQCPYLQEVSIGHAQICRALQIGTTQAIQELLSALAS
jgi:pyridoxine 5-phosphate synthase